MKWNRGETVYKGTNLGPFPTIIEVLSFEKFRGEKVLGRLPLLENTNIIFKNILDNKRIMVINFKCHLVKTNIPFNSQPFGKCIQKITSEKLNPPR